MSSVDVFMSQPVNIAPSSSRSISLASSSSDCLSAADQVSIDLLDAQTSSSKEGRTGEEEEKRRKEEEGGFEDRRVGRRAPELRAASCRHPSFFALMLLPWRPRSR